MGKTGNNVLDTIFCRFSYRGQFKDTAVPRVDLETIVRAGFAAPSGCNRQTTAFVAIDSPEKVAAIKRIFKKPSCQSAPAFILVFTQRIEGVDGQYYNVEDFAAAMENMILAIEAMGYATCWYQGSIRNCKKELAKIVKMPEQYTTACLLPVGIAAGENPQRAQKKPFAERAWFNEYLSNR